MILVDKNIKQIAQSIIDCYDEKNVTAVSYDLALDFIISEDGNCDTYELEPQETIFIKTIEKITMPDNLMGRIGEKNSLMRLGLSVTGPHYYPGHETYMYLRVQNISPNQITISKGDKIAQLFFEQLSDVPEIPYDRQENASFNQENKYRGVAGYKSEYDRKIRKLEKTSEILDEKENNIYVNIMTIMGIFVSIFSLIMVNFSNINDNFNEMSAKILITINVSLGVVIALFMGLILIFLNKAKNKKFLLAYIIIMLVLLILLFLLLL